VEHLRSRQVKNFLTATLLSVGMPMILMGDEARHTQGGNNNAYCQDNSISWFDWQRLEKHADIHRFVKLLMARRLLRGTQHETERRSLNVLLREASKSWHGVRLHQPDWSDHSRSLAFTARIQREKLSIHLLFNAYWEPLEFELPLPGSARGTWRRWIDTALPAPEDIVPWMEAPPVLGLKYRAADRSVVVLYEAEG
jgi:glycogen operon protein